MSDICIIFGLDILRRTTRSFYYPLHATACYRKAGIWHHWFMSPCHSRDEAREEEPCNLVMFSRGDHTIVIKTICANQLINSRDKRYVKIYRDVGYLIRITKKHNIGFWYSWFICSKRARRDITWRNATRRGCDAQFTCYAIFGRHFVLRYQSSR